MIYEVFLVHANVDVAAWQNFIHKVAECIGPAKHWKLHVYFASPVIHFFLESPVALPASVNGCENFILKLDPAPPKVPIKKILHWPKFFSSDKNAVDLHQNLKRRGIELTLITCDFRQLNSKKIVTTIHFVDKPGRRRLLLPSFPTQLLAVNFDVNHKFLRKSPPKYLDIQKSLKLFSANAEYPVAEIDAYPYLDEQLFLGLDTLDFARHSIVLGASGSGKSKFLSLLIENILRCPYYKVVVIDPHAALEKDIGVLGKTVDFKDPQNFLDLFNMGKNSIVASVELLLDVFRGLIPNRYNSRLERVLRHSLFLLLTEHDFNFKTLRKLLLDLEFRNQKLALTKSELPSSVVEFFLSEFNDLRTKYYTDSISPIIALIDELELIPVFDRDLAADTPDLEQTIKKNNLSLFSLDRTQLGDRATETIAGLLMCQLFNLAQNHQVSEHIVLVVDEVAVVENPVLPRFLSEARKYNLSIILAGQYFGGISADLRTSIFANAINYYVFRVSKDDAALLVGSLSMKIPLEDTDEKKIQMLTGLQDRECLLRISGGGELLPAFKCRTPDFVPKPRVKKAPPSVAEPVTSDQDAKPSPTTFSTATDYSMHDILKLTSTKRSSAKERTEQ